jgi:hypothetical protein
MIKLEQLMPFCLLVLLLVLRGERLLKEGADTQEKTAGALVNADTRTKNNAR